MRPVILLALCALVGACTRPSDAASTDTTAALRTALRDQRDAGLALDSALLRAIAITDERAREGLPAAAPADSEYWRNWRDVTARQHAFDSVSARSARLLAR